MVNSAGLGDPPGFGASGAPPPLTGPPVIIASTLFCADSATNEYVPTLGVNTALGIMSLLVPPVGVFVLGHQWGSKRRQRRAEQRQLVYSQVWEREDPTIVVPPGASRKKLCEVSVGVTTAETRELSTSLGLKVGHGGTLAGELASKFQIQTTLKEQHKVTDEVPLLAHRTKRRRYAIWSVRHTLAVYRLAPSIRLTKAELASGHIDPAARTLVSSVSFRPSMVSQANFCDLDR